MILGHAHQDVVKAVQNAVKKGVSYGTTTKPEIEIAQFIVKHVPSVDMVRFVNSGTEATMSAIRLAGVLPNAIKSSNLTVVITATAMIFWPWQAQVLLFWPASSSQGIPGAHIQDTLSLPFNDTQALINTIERHHADIACVIVEPVAGNMGVINPEQGFS